MSIIKDAFRVAALLAHSACALAAGGNTITFDNQSGADALVKLVGPSRAALAVPDRTRTGVPVVGGEYYILVRYGAAGHYAYTKGNGFVVEESKAAYSLITITLHKVVYGNYPSRPTSQAEFDRQ
jgi:hypothetical protein